jgi:hypothetical protein
MNTLKVLLVDDETRDVSTLAVYRLLVRCCVMEVEYRNSYSMLGTAAEDIRRSVAKYDVLVLDVLMGIDTEPFMRVVRAIAGAKPFLVFTKLTDESPLDQTSTRECLALGDFVLEKGGLGVITKRTSQAGTLTMGAEWEVVEKLTAFYWARV